MKPRCITSERWASQGELQRWGFAGGLFVTCIFFGSHCISHFPWSSALRYEALVPIFFSRISLSASIIAMLSRFANQLAVDALSQFIQHTTYIITYSIYTHTLPSFLLFFYTLSLSWTLFFHCVLKCIFTTHSVAKGFAFQAPNIYIAALGFLQKSLSGTAILRI